MRCVAHHPAVFPSPGRDQGRDLRKHQEPATIHWWLERTGEEVIELGRRYVEPTGATAADPTLFDDIDDGT